MFARIPRPSFIRGDTRLKKAVSLDKVRDLVEAGSKRVSARERKTGGGAGGETSLISLKLTTATAFAPVIPAVILVLFNASSSVLPGRLSSPLAAGDARRSQPPASQTANLGLHPRDKYLLLSATRFPSVAILFNFAAGYSSSLARLFPFSFAFYSKFRRRSLRREKMTGAPLVKEMEALDRRKWGVFKNVWFLGCIFWDNILYGNTSPK